MTEIATLAADAAYRLLSQFLTSNGGCQLPCWWGVTPGESAPLDANSEWGALLGAAEYADLSATGDGDIGFQLGFDDLSVMVDVDYSVDPNSEVIQQITINTQALRKIRGGYEPVYDAEHYQDLLHPYMLPELLSTYGSPEQVVLSMEIISAEPTSPDLFRIWLLYPKEGAIARYTLPAEVSNGTIRGCPSSSFVDMWLLPAGDVESYQNILSEITGSPWQATSPLSPYFKPIEDATGVTLGQFYQTYSKPTETCLETPLSIWPAH